MQTDKMTTDQIFALFLVHGTRKEIENVSRELKIAAGDLCPECGGTETESNGLSGQEEGFRCCKCDHRWDVADQTITVPSHFPGDEDED